MKIPIILILLVSLLGRVSSSEDDHSTEVDDNHDHEEKHSEEHHDSEERHSEEHHDPEERHSEEHHDPEERHSGEHHDPEEEHSGESHDQGEEHSEEHHDKDEEHSEEHHDKDEEHSGEHHDEHEVGHSEERHDPDEEYSEEKSIEDNRKGHSKGRRHKGSIRVETSQSHESESSKESEESHEDEDKKLSFFGKLTRRRYHDDDDDDERTHHSRRRLRYKPRLSRRRGHRFRKRQYGRGLLKIMKSSSKQASKNVVPEKKVPVISPIDSVSGSSSSSSSESCSSSSESSSSSEEIGGFNYGTGSMSDRRGSNFREAPLTPVEEDFNMANLPSQNSSSSSKMTDPLLEILDTKNYSSSKSSSAYKFKVKKYGSSRRKGDKHSELKRRTKVLMNLTDKLKTSPNLTISQMVKLARGHKELKQEVEENHMTLQSILNSAHSHNTSVSDILKHIRLYKAAVDEKEKKFSNAVLYHVTGNLSNSTVYSNLIPKNGTAALNAGSANGTVTTPAANATTTTTPKPK